MRLFAGLEEITSENEPLAPHTTFRLGGPASRLVRPRSEAELAEVLRRARLAELPLRMLGGGANLLVREQGVPGVVVQLDAPAWKQVHFAEDGVRAGGGVNMARLVNEAARHGLAGLERMAGIPGSVGGCVRMNAGGRGGSIGELVRTVRVMDPSGQVSERTGRESDFGYRRSHLDGLLVLSVDLSLEPDDPQRVRRRRDEMWRYKQATQPLSEHSAGCIFRNPVGHSAGRLIEEAGLKGRRIGGAEVSRKHANFIVARTGGRTDDVLRLISVIQQTVNDRYDVCLDLEVEVW